MEPTYSDYSAQALAASGLASEQLGIDVTTPSGEAAVALTTGMATELYEEFPTGSVAGFEIGALIAILLPFLIEQLKKSFGIVGPEGVYRQVRLQGFWAKFRAQQAVDKFERKHRVDLTGREEQRLNRALVRSNRHVSDAQLRTMLQEVKLNVADVD